MALTLWGHVTLYNRWTCAKDRYGGPLTPFLYPVVDILNFYSQAYSTWKCSATQCCVYFSGKMGVIAFSTVDVVYSVH